MNALDPATWNRRRVLGLGMLCLAGCAHRDPGPPANWTGRLSLKSADSSASSFHAGFELDGSAEAGSLRLTSPVGTVLAELSWSPSRAKLQRGQETQSFDSLPQMALELTGTELPIAALFGWLQGRDVQATGWIADLSQLANGRLTVRRPSPEAELRLILDPKP